MSRVKSPGIEILVVIGRMKSGGNNGTQPWRRAERGKGRSAGQRDEQHLSLRIRTSPVEYGSGMVARVDAPDDIQGFEVLGVFAMSGA
jgi:hypothetical protein